MKNSICLYCSYSKLDTIADYIRVYLKELNSFFTKIIFVTNKRQINHESISWLNEMHIELLYVTNEGYDFGMWYKAMQTYDCTAYDKVGLINDSCILFKKLDKEVNWIETHDLDYCGLVSFKRYAYHVQSFFVVMNKKAFSLLVTYLKNNGFINDYRQIIKIYEIGISQYLIKNGLKLGAVYEYMTLNLTANPTFPVLPELIYAGMPMIKKKILLRSYRPGELWGLMAMNVDIDEQNYIRMIKEVNPNPLLLDLDKTLAQHHVKERRLYKQLYRVGMKMVSFLKQFKVVKKIYRFLIHFKHILEGRDESDI